MSLRLARYKGNPIIKPRPGNPWECGGTFNPAAIKIGNKIHILYRAITKNNISVFCHAVSSDGYSIDERDDEPAYIPRERFEINPGFKGKIDPNEKINNLIINYRLISGAGYFGCEDPRLTRIGNRIYLTYVAFDGWNPMRIAFSSIKVKDFVEGNWNWEKPRAISPPDIPDKNGVLFPEKIKGRYFFFHRIFPYIWADSVKDFSEFDKGKFLFGHACIYTRPDKWDSRKIGAGPPPFRKWNYWILVYHGVSGWDPWYWQVGITPEMILMDDGYRYKIGIMALDIKNPGEVIYRSPEPVLEPELPYERSMAYPCGAVIKNGKLLVYYGAGDFYVGVATLELERLKEEIKRGEKVEVDEEYREPYLEAKYRAFLRSKGRL